MNRSLVTLCLAMWMLVGCAKSEPAEPAVEPVAEPTPVAAPEPVAQEPEEPEPSADEVPVIADFEEEAEAAIQPDNYLAELDKLAAEDEADEP